MIVLLKKKKQKNIYLGYGEMGIHGKGLYSHCNR